MAGYLPWSDVPVLSTIKVNGRVFTVVKRTEEPLTLTLYDGKDLFPGTPPDPSAAVEVVSQPLARLPDLWGEVVITGTSEIIPDVCTAILQGAASGMAVRVTIERNAK